MMDTSRIKEHMEVVGSDGQHVGTVDCVKGDEIILTKKDSEEGVHHLIPLDWVESVEQNEVRLNKMGAEAQAEWVETGDEQSGSTAVCP